jgi:hypothetical protein
LVDSLPLGVQLATGTRLVLLTVQLVVMKLGPALVPAVQVSTGVGPLKVVGVQVVVT